MSEPAAQQTIEAFLGESPKAITTPPVDEYDNPIYSSSGSSSSATPSTAASGGAGTTSVTAPAIAKPAVESYDPTPC